jgi:hypothetical protein
MRYRIILSIACILLLADYVFPQNSTAPDSNLYLKALSACVEKQAKEYKDIDKERNFLNIIVEYHLFLTRDLPTQIGEYRIEYLNGDELVARYKKVGKPFPIISMRPMVTEEGMLRVGLADYWFSYKKRSLNFSLEGGCNVLFRYDCEQKAFMLDKVDLWGI